MNGLPFSVRNFAAPELPSRAHRRWPPSLPGVGSCSEGCPGQPGCQMRCCDCVLEAGAIASWRGAQDHQAVW